MWLMAFFILLFTNVGYGQKYQYTDEIAKKSDQEKMEEKNLSLIGKKYWLDGDSQPIGFLETPQWRAGVRQFNVSGKTSFEINDVTKDGLYVLYKVTFEDGKVGFLKDIDWNISKYRGYDDINSLDRQYIFDEDPDLMRARLKKQKLERAKKRQKAEADRKARGGVKIGMTKEQVLSSSWGKPNKVNTTKVKNLIHEQWIYDGGYLYFENDILTGIQN
jgi:hypothetical protein